MVISKTPNMATTPGHSLNSFVPTPKTFNIGDNIEEFLEEIERFYQLTETRGPLQNTFIKAFLSTEAIKSYESVDENIEDYAARCRKAFEEPASIAKDFYAAIQYRKGEDSATQYLKKINRLADNIMRHELTKEKLVSFLLQNGIDDIDTKKEVKLRGATHPEEIHSIISKMEDINREIQMENTVAALRTQKKTYVRAAQHQ